MKDEEVVDLLRHYRHDWMNELQVIMGYAQMGKIEKVQQKIEQSVENARLERELQSMSLPRTVLWLTRFKWRFDNYQLIIKLDLSEPLTVDDRQLSEQLEIIMALFNTYSMKTEMYHGTIRLQRLKIQLSFSGIFEKSHELKNKIEHSDELLDVEVEQSQHGHEICTVTWISE